MTTAQIVWCFIAVFAGGLMLLAATVFKKRSWFQRAMLICCAVLVFTAAAMHFLKQGEAQLFRIALCVSGAFFVGCFIGNFREIRAAMKSRLPRCFRREK